MADLSYGYHAVAFLDILGQQNEWKEEEGLPENKEEFDILLKKLRRTIGFIDELRKQLKATSEIMSGESEFQSKLSEPIKSEFKRLKNSDVIIQTFSDSFVVSASLRITKDVPVPINGLREILFGSALTQIYTLARKHVMRGGITVSTGIRMPEGKEIYGPALNEAYLLEKDIADYPRIVIGNGVMDYLNECLNVSGDSKEDKLTKLFAERCKSIITLDEDGVPILDFLCKEIVDLTKNLPASADGKEILVLVKEHITEQLNYWKNLRDEKLISRYERLMKYFNSRVEPHLKIK